jgi:hypothetical protein
LANMRGNGARSLLIWCRNCHHEKIMNVDHLPGNLTVPSLGQRMSCIKCGTVGAEVRPTAPSVPETAPARPVGACHPSKRSAVDSPATGTGRI